ncbi:hypothetical protein PMIN01_09675 [Paraphaeosphaeria minitans]|uniref:Uncharacterized protein n=1 Tax=Paraphaeosphaeria minitans TaxID=565426 RepID=A0A9P6KNA3_9PLEO|nr:hypothetical protein PMIN01_09675 [Paraphaeosphaeria minitans]
MAPSRTQKPTAANVLKARQLQRVYAINTAFRDDGYSIGQSKGSTEPFPDFSDSADSVRSQGTAYCTCMLHCQHTICSVTRYKRLKRGDAVPSCPNPRTCRELLRSRHGLRPLHLVRAPNHFPASFPPWLLYAPRRASCRWPRPCNAQKIKKL